MEQIMSYLVEIENIEQGKSLINYLKTLNFVKILNNADTDFDNEILFDNSGNPLSDATINTILNKSENSNNITLSDAIQSSSEWKNQLL